MGAEQSDSDKVNYYGNRIVQVRVKNDHYLSALKTCIDSGFTITDLVNEVLMLIATETESGLKIVQNMARKRQRELLKKFNVDPDLRVKLPVNSSEGESRKFVSNRKLTKIVKKQQAKTGNFDTKTLYDLIGDNGDDTISEESSEDNDQET